MLFYLINRTKTVKALRRKAGYTATEMAMQLQCETTAILAIDSLPLRGVDQGLRERLIAVFKGGKPKY